MTRLLVLVAAALAFASPPPVAADDARPQLTQRGCAVAADMVLTARALALENVHRAQAASIMARIYVSQEPGAAAVRDRAAALAYSRTEAPTDLARLVWEACMRTGGDQGAMFGTRIRHRPAPPPGLRL